MNRFTGTAWGGGGCSCLHEDKTKQPMNVMTKECSLHNTIRSNALIMRRNFAHRFFQIYFARQKLEESIDRAYFRCYQVRFGHKKIEICNHSLLVLKRDNAVNILCTRLYCRPANASYTGYFCNWPARNCTPYKSGISSSFHPNSHSVPEVPTSADFQSAKNP